MNTKKLDPHEQREQTDTTIEENADEQVPAQKIKKLSEKLKQCEQERSDYLAGWQRAKADFINARKEDEKRRNEFFRHAEASLMKELLPLGDSFESARAMIRVHNEESGQWLKGIESIAQQFWKVLRQHGVEQILTKEKTFDPTLHEAVATMPVTTPEEDLLIMREEQAGYRLGDITLRPARVQIGKFNEAPTSKSVGIKRNSSEAEYPPSLARRASEGLFSSLSSDEQIGRYSAKENKHPPEKTREEGEKDT